MLIQKSLQGYVKIITTAERSREEFAKEFPISFAEKDFTQLNRQNEPSLNILRVSNTSLTLVIVSSIFLFAFLLTLSWPGDCNCSSDWSQPGPQLFLGFIENFSKKYSNEEELNRRCLIFLSNYVELEREIEKQPDVRFDIHQWMDLTDEEIREALALNVPGDIPFKRDTSSLFEKFPETVNRAESHSWRSKSTPVKNQGSCGSCWAFSVVASVESVSAIEGQPLVSLSEQELIDCDPNSMGCKGGVRQYAMNFVRNTGLVPDAGYPYLGKEGQECKLNGNQTIRVKITDFRNLAPNEETMADWVFQKGPITIGMSVTKGLYAYRSGVFSPSAEDCVHKSDGSHAVTVIGYGTENGKKFWEVKNSWGSYWGDSGYFKLERGINSCGVANNVVAPIL